MRLLTSLQELSSCWDGRPFGHNRNGPKIGRGCAPVFLQGGSWSQSNTMWPGPAYLRVEFHLDPSNRLATIHQCHRRKDRQTGQRSDSIGRTVLQTVSQ